MRDAIAYLLRSLLVWFFPATGRHRTRVHPVPAPPSSLSPWSRPWPEERSKYAQEAASPVWYVDTEPLRPYVIGVEFPQRSEKEWEQAARRWALDMEARGIDVGPDVIHGVHVNPDSRTIAVA